MKYRFNNNFQRIEKPNKRETSGMFMMNEYTVEAASNRRDLIRIVRKMMTKGWQPIGGVAVDIHGEDDRVIQAMVREQK